MSRLRMEFSPSELHHGTALRRSEAVTRLKLVDSRPPSGSGMGIPFSQRRTFLETKIQEEDHSCEHNHHFRIRQVFSRARSRAATEGAKCRACESYVIFRYSSICVQNPARWIKGKRVFEVFLSMVDGIDWEADISACGEVMAINPHSPSKDFTEQWAPYWRVHS